MLSHAISHIGSLWLSGRASERGWSEVRFLTETQNFSLSYARDKTINVFRYFFHLTYDIHVVIESVSLMKNCHVFIQDYKRLHGLLIRTLVTPLFACYLMLSLILGLCGSVVEHRSVVGLKFDSSRRLRIFLCHTRVTRR